MVINDSCALRTYFTHITNCSLVQTTANNNNSYITNNLIIDQNKLLWLMLLKLLEQRIPLEAQMRKREKRGRKFSLM